MGQSQSTGTPVNPDHMDDRTSKIVDYYKLLDLERDASEDEIKRAYRKKALELHPDRNYGNTEASAKLFTEIQCAYEVLCNPQERAWYDSHRDVIFTEESSSGNETLSDIHMTSASDILTLLFKFSPRMEFLDSFNGFFGALGENFDKIAREETLVCQWDRIDTIQYPSFGKQDDDFEEVVRPFYAAWNNFSTRKSFTWKDIHRYSEAPDRRIRRLMEKENKRLREDGIREYNDAVRSLVAFVKKRDPRYKANLHSEAERQRMLRECAASQGARSRAANQAKFRDYITPDWARTEEPHEEPSSSEPDLEQFECVICRKMFKSEKQFEAHAHSKKHIRAARQLRREMTIEDEELQLDTDSPQAKVQSQFPTQDTNQSARSFGETVGVLSGDINSSMRSTEGPLLRNQLILGSQDDDSDHATREAVEARMSPEQSPSQTATLHVPQLLKSLSGVSPDNYPDADRLKIGKAKRKRAKKIARIPAAGVS